MCIGIYLIRNKINNKVYVGQSVNIKDRWSNHKRELEKGIHYNDHLQKSYNKYGKINFEFKVIEYCEEEKLDELEVYWIKYFDSMKWEKGYNSESGGNKNKRFSEERIKKITGEGNPMFNKNHTEETKNIIRNKNRGQNSKLTIKQVSEIKKRLFEGETCKNLSKEFNVDITTISKIFTCVNWEWVNPELNYCLKNHKEIEDKKIIEEANKLFDEGKSINQIHLILNVGQKKISNILNSKLKERNKKSIELKKQKETLKRNSIENKEKLKESILKMKSKGMLNKDIAKSLNIHRTTVTEYLKKYAPEYLRK